MSESIRVDDLEQHEVDERQIVLLMRDWRHGRATRNMRQALSDGYVALFTLVLMAAMVVNVIIKAQRSVSDCSTTACVSGRGLLPWAALAGVLGAAFAAARMFGPVLASAAEGFWLMDAPLRRSRLLMRRLVTALGAALVLGLAVGALVAALTGSPGLSVVYWCIATGCAAMGGTALSASEQTWERTWLVRTLQTLASLAALAVLVMVIGTAAGWFNVTIDAGTSRMVALIVAIAGVALTLICGFVGARRLELIRRTRLTSGGSLMAGMQGAMFALDLGLMRDIVVEREAVARGHVRATRGRGMGLQALVWRDVQRVLRFPRQLAGLVVAAVVPYAVQALGLGSLNVTISALVLMVALIPTFNTLRVLARTKGLARCLPYSTGQIRTAASIVPSILALLWTLAVIPGFIGLGASSGHRNPVEGVLVAVVSGAAGLVAAIRWVSAKSPNYSGPMIATQAGAMPPGMMVNLIRGFDMVAVISLPVVFGLPVWVSLVIAVIAFAVLRSGGIDQEALAEMQKENQQRVAEAKGQINGKPKEKIKVTRGR